MKSMSNWYVVLAALVFPLVGFAEEGAHAAASNATLYIPLAVGFGIGIAVLGAALAQGKIASAFMEGVARNPGAADVLRAQLILSLALVESLALLAWVLAFMLQGKM